MMNKCCIWIDCYVINFGYHAECCSDDFVLLSVALLSVVMLSVDRLSVDRLSVDTLGFLC
jgi:hypothetical protein